MRNCAIIHPLHLELETALSLIGTMITATGLVGISFKQSRVRMRPVVTNFIGVAWLMRRRMERSCRL
jgi:hypothetical protein